MDRLSLDEQLEVLRGDEPETADARRHVAENAEAARRSERLNRFDAAVGSAVRKVEVPAGLADRVLGRLETVTQETRRRRRFLYAGVGSALAMTLIIGFALWNRPDSTWTSTRVAEEATRLFGRRHELTPPDEKTPPLPSIGLGGAILGFSEVPFLKKFGEAFRLQAPGGQEAVAIIVYASWFPEGFDFSATYSVVGEDTMEVRFRAIPGTDQWCIVVARDLRPFEARPLIF